MLYASYARDYLAGVRVGGGTILCRLEDLHLGRVLGPGPCRLAAFHYVKSSETFSATRDWAAASPLVSPPDPFLRPRPAGAGLQVHAPARKPAPSLPEADKTTGIASLSGVDTSSASPLPAPSNSALVNLSLGMDASPPIAGIANRNKAPPIIGRARASDFTGHWIHM